MDIFSILLLCLLGYNNSTKAKLKGQNGLLWGVITIVSFIVFQAIGLYAVIVMFCRGEVDMSMLSRANGNFDAISKQFNDQVAKAVMDNPLRYGTVFLFGFGGYLLVRYLIDRKPD